MSFTFLPLIDKREQRLYNKYMYDFIFNENTQENKKGLSVRGFTETYKNMLVSVLSDGFRLTDTPSLVIAESDELAGDEGIPAIIIGSSAGKKSGRAYLSRPVNIKELRMLAAALSEKREAPSNPEAVVTNDDGCTVSYGGSTARLTKLEYELFIMLKNADAPLSREYIRERLWKNTEKTNISDVYVCYLRKKLSHLFGEGFIVSIRGKGYVMRLP